MRDDPDLKPIPGTFLTGVTVSEAMALRAEAQARADAAEAEGLRLDLVDRFDEEPRPRLRAPSRTALITFWALGLIAALAIAAYVQVSQQRTAAIAVDRAPPPPSAAPAEPTTPNPPEPALPAAAAIVAKAPVPKPKAEKAVSAAVQKAPTDKKLPPDIVRLRVQLNHAYNQAVKAGVPRSVLKARRAEWRVLYEQARKTSPAAVAALYQVRAVQLEALTERQRPSNRTTN